MTMGKLATDLIRGVIRDVQAWDLGKAVEQINKEIDRNSLFVNSAQSAAKTLINSRHYEHVVAITQHWIKHREFDPLLTKYLAQALTNLGALEAAEKVISDYLPQLKKQTKNASAILQIPEFEGLLGRLLKQRYVETHDPTWLVKSVNQYLSTYNDDHRRYWHGINAVALRAREEREGLINFEVTFSSRELAKQVLKIAKERYFEASDDPFSAATVSEAYLALGECDSAELWLYRFLMHPDVRPFDIESYDRQIREIWSGNPLAGCRSCADRLSTIMARHIAQKEHRFFISSADVSETKQSIDSLSAQERRALEKNFNGESMLTLDSLKKLLIACESVGCVMTVCGKRVGTGFLLSDSAFNRAENSAPVFITNAHVISADVDGAIAPEEAWVTFEVESTAKGILTSYKVGEILFTSPPGDLGITKEARKDLDVTVARLNKLPATAQGLKKAKYLPLIDSTTRVYVVGHPRGSGLQISMQDSGLLDIDDHERLIHYRTPTDPGSSGSPVFNTKWEVVALHHGGASSAPRLHGSGTYEANEGISLLAIEEAWLEQVAGKLTH